MRTINHTYSAGSGIELDCELEYDPGEPANPDPESATCGPAWPPVAYLISAKVHGLDILPVLDPTIIEQIEASACSMLD
jgi:hypothetical protein